MRVNPYTKKIRSLKIIYGLTPVVVLGLSLFFMTQGVVGAEEKICNEILIEIQSNIIVLPKNIEIVKVPILTARVRSTVLREFHRKYNAVSIERLYKLQDIPDTPEAKEILLGEGVIDLTGAEGITASTVFTYEKKKELIEERKISEDQEVVEAKNTFLVCFESEAGAEIDMNAVVAEYRALPYVRSARHVILNRE